MAIARLLLSKAFSLLTRPESVAFLALAIVAAFTYFPATQISVEGNDTLDSFLPTNSMAPPIWETIFRLDANAPTLDGLSLNMLAFSEFDFTRLIFSIFPRYSEISWFYFLSILALYASFVIAMHCLKVGLIQKSLSISFDNAAIAIGGILLALMPHNSVMLAPLVACNLFAAAAFLIVFGGRAWQILTLLGSSAFFGDISSGSYLYIGLFFVATLGFAAATGNFRPVLYAVAMIVFAVLADYRTIAGLVMEEPSHRSTWLDNASTSVSITEPAAWNAALAETNKLIFGRPAHYHYQWNTKLAPLIAGGIGLCGYASYLAFIFILQRKRASITSASRSFAIAALVAALCAIIALAYGILNTGMIPVQAWLHLTLQVERVITLLPFLAGTFVVFALSPLAQLITSNAVKGTLAIAGVAIVAAYIHDPFLRKSANLEHFAKAGPTNPFVPNYTVGTHYQRGVFNALKEKLGSTWPNERVISIGNDPMIADYNGFRHLDGYYFQYPKAYQRAFRKIVEPNLVELPDKGALFDGWGSRFGVSIVKRIGEKVHAPMDGCAFASLGGTLALSWSELDDPAASQLDFDGSVEALTEGLTAQLFLYRPSHGCTQNNIRLPGQT